MVALRVCVFVRGESPYGKPVDGAYRGSQTWTQTLMVISLESGRVERGKPRRYRIVIDFV
jgi:hypothetical protein